LTNQYNQPLLPQVQRFVASRARHDLTPLSSIAGKVYSDDLEEILEPLIAWTKRINIVEAVEPLHAAEIKEEYLAKLSKKNYTLCRSTRHPGFSYEPNKTGLEFSSLYANLVAAGEKVRALPDKDYAARLGKQLALAKIADWMESVNLIDAISDKRDDIAMHSIINMYGDVTPELVAYAQHPDWCKPVGLENYRQRQFTSDEVYGLRRRIITAYDLAEMCIWALKQYGAYAENDADFGYRIVTSEATSIDVRDVNSSGHPAIVIPSTYNLPGQQKTIKELLSLMEHEIQGHVRQSLTLAKVFGFGGLNLKFNAETNYESIGKWNDARFALSLGHQASIPQPWYTLGIHLARQGKGFDEVFHALLREKISASANKDPAAHASEVYRTCQRIFRGCSDVNRNRCGYAFTKDLAYLAGFLEISQLAQYDLENYELLANVSSYGLDLLRDLEIDSEFSWPYPYRTNMAAEYYSDVLRYTLAHRQEMRIVD